MLFRSVIPFVNTPVEFGIIWTGYEITTSFCTIFLSSLFASNIEEEYRGSGSGIFSSGADLGRAIGALVGGATLGQIGLLMPFILGALFCIITGIVIAVAVRGLKVSK